MALALDASTPAYVSSGVGVTSLTTAAFTPPAGALLLALSGLDTQANVTETASTVTGTTSAWTKREHTVLQGATDIDSATVTSAVSTTVRASWGQSSDCQLYVPVITGADTAAPIGASGSYLTNASTSTITFTATRPGSLVFVTYEAYQGGSVPTSAQLTLVGSNTTNSTKAVFRMTTPSVAGTNTISLTGHTTTNAAVSWIEVVPAAVQPTTTVGTPYQSTTSVTTATVTLPTGLVAGDATYLFCTLNSSSGVITGPAGWTTVQASTNSSSATSTSHVVAIFSKFWVSGDTNPVVTCTSGRFAILPVKVSNTDVTTPIEAAVGYTTQTSATAAVDAPSQTATNSRLLVTMHSGRSALNGTFITWTPPTGMTELGEAVSSEATSTNPSLEVNSLVLGASGATGAKTATASATATGSAGVSLLPNPIVARVASTAKVVNFTGSGALTASGSATIPSSFSASVSLSGSGALTAAVTPALPQAVPLSGSGTLTATGSTVSSSKWINRTLVSATRNGTTSHTISFTPATSGNLLVAVMEGSVTSSTPTGWTLPTGGSSVNSTGIYVWYKTATSGESSFSTTHNGSNYPVGCVVYEFAVGSTFVQAASTTNNTSPTLSGLTGTNLLMSAIGVAAPGTAVASYSWTAPSPGIIEDAYSAADGSPTDGYSMSVAYVQGSTATSFAPQVTPNGSAATKEWLSFAIQVAASGTVFSGSAALSATGTLSVSRTVTLSGSAALSGAGTLSTSQTVALTGSAGLSGSGALSAVGATNPKISTISATFDTTIPAFFNDNFGGPTVSGGQLVLPTIPAYSGVATLSKYDLGGSAVSVQVVTNPGVSGTREFFFQMNLDATNKVQMYDSGGSFVGRVQLAGVNTTAVLPAYNATSHAWWRIRESSGTVFFEAAPDGVTWSVLGQVTNPGLSLGAMTLSMSAGYYGTETSPPSAVIDNLNVTPAAFSGTAGLSGSGTLSATRTVALIGSAALTGSGTLTASGSATGTATGTVSLSGSGTLTATATATPTAAVSLTGSGTLSTTRTLTATAAVSLSGSGVLSAVGAPQGSFAGSAALTGSGALTATATIVITRAVALSGSGTLTVTAAPLAAGSVSLTGSGTLTASGSGGATIQNSSGAVSLSGSGVLSATSTTMTVTRAAVLTASGQLSALMVPKLTRAVALSGSGTLTAAKTLFVSIGTFYLWDGTTAVPLVLAGVWDGTTLKTAVPVAVQT